MPNKSKVYVPQIPSRFDSTLRSWVPTVNIHGAEKFGEVIVMLPPEANRMHIVPLVQALKEGMKDFNENDHLVAVGDPSLLAAAAVLAAKKSSGVLRILKWDRMTSSYIPVEMQL